MPAAAWCAWSACTMRSGECTGLHLMAAGGCLRLASTLGPRGSLALCGCMWAAVVAVAVTAAVD